MRYRNDEEAPRAPPARDPCASKPHAHSVVARYIETPRHGLVERAPAPCTLPRVCVCVVWGARYSESWRPAHSAPHMPRYLPPHAPLSTTPCPMPRCLSPRAPLPTIPCPAVYHPMLRCLPPHAPLSTNPCNLALGGGVLVAVAAVKTRRRLARTLGRVRGAGTGLEPSLGHGRSGSLQWLPARVMFGLPRWHTQRCGRCPNSRDLFGQRRSTS